MEGDRPDQGRGGGEPTTGLGAQTKNVGKSADYEFSLPSNNKDIQVRYVDRRGDPSSYPCWIITDNSTPKFDANRGFWSRDRVQTDSDSKKNTSPTAEVANEEEAGNTVPRRSTTADLFDSVAEAPRNGKKKYGYELDHKLTVDAEASSIPGLVGAADEDPIAGTAEDWETDDSGAEDEEEDGPSLRGAAASKGKKSVRFGGVQVHVISPPGPASSLSTSDKSTVDTLGSQMGTARANRLARAEARKAKMSKRASDVSANVSAEAQQIAEWAENDDSFDVNNAVARVRLNRDRGLRTRNHRPNYALVTPLEHDDGGEENEDGPGSNNEDVEGLGDDNVSTQSFGSVNHSPGHSDKAKETEDTSWAPNKDMDRTPAPGRPAKKAHGTMVGPGAVKPKGRGRAQDLNVERPFVCSICSNAFVRREHLRRHIKTKHSDEKPHVCEVCGKTFARRDNLRQHMKVHEETVNQEAALGNVEQAWEIEEAVRAQQMHILFGQRSAGGMGYSATPYEDAARDLQKRLEDADKR